MVVTGGKAFVSVVVTCDIMVLGFIVSVIVKARYSVNVSVRATVTTMEVVVVVLVTGAKVTGGKFFFIVVLSKSYNSMQ